MENILKTLEYWIFKRYETNPENFRDYVWDYNKLQESPQLEHNNGFNDLLLKVMFENDLDVIIANGVTCAILENFQSFQVIGESDVYNYKRYKSDIPKDFEPFFLIKDGDKNIGVVIKSNIRLKQNQVILTNSGGFKYRVIEINNLPEIKLIECFKK